MDGIHAERCSGSLVDLAYQFLSFWSLHGLSENAGVQLWTLENDQCSSFQLCLCCFGFQMGLARSLTFWAWKLIGFIPPVWETLWI